jgi:3-methyl-2-oxobutanoate hydroxymethyltransferase
MTTAYDYPTARFVDEAGFDLLLIGDSVGPLMLGYKNTIPVTIEEVIHHGKAVVKGAPHVFTIMDMPFASYEMGGREAVKNALHVMKETGADSVKIEGGEEMADVIQSIVKAGIPTMGHIGLTPQKISMLGGIKVQGENFKDAKKLFNDAKAIEKAGAFAIVLEFVASEVAKAITERLTIPTIGIGAGPYCDGQELVITDILGIYDKVPPFSKRYINLRNVIVNALKSFIEEAKERKFPTEEHTFHMEKNHIKEFEDYVKSGKK